MRKKTTGRVFKSKGISFDPDFLRRAEARAKALGLGFSEYVRKVLAGDIKRGGNLTLTPEEDAQSSAQGSSKTGKAK